jgi:hypothetical protein
MSDTEPRFLGWPGPPAHRHCGEASFGFGDFDFCLATMRGEMVPEQDNADGGPLGREVQGQVDGKC